MEKYLFEEELISGLIKSRPNRFIMLVEINGTTEKCHCPATGKIGNIEFKNIPCLLSKSDNPARKTKYTVEAISRVPKTWIGINQTKANNYIEFFLRANQLKKIILVKDLKREVKLNLSRIDFLVNDNTFLEVKTPLRFLPFGNKKEKEEKFNSFERLNRHFNDISKEIKNNKRAIVILCYLFNAERFKAPKTGNTKEVSKINSSLSKGIELWQVNLKVDKKGVSLIDYYKLN